MGAFPGARNYAMKTSGLARQCSSWLPWKRTSGSLKILFNSVTVDDALLAAAGPLAFEMQLVYVSVGTYH